MPMGKVEKQEARIVSQLSRCISKFRSSNFGKYRRFFICSLQTLVVNLRQLLPSTACFRSQSCRSPACRAPRWSRQYSWLSKQTLTWSPGRGLDSDALQQKQKSCWGRHPPVMPCLTADRLLFGGQNILAGMDGGTLFATDIAAKQQVEAGLTLATFAACLSDTVEILLAPS